MKRKRYTSLLCCCLLALSSQICSQVPGSNSQKLKENDYSDFYSADRAMQEGKFEKATDYYEHYLNSNKPNREVIITLFRLYLAQGEYKSANKLLALYSKKFGTDSLYLRERVNYLVAVNKSSDALQTMTVQKNNNLSSILSAAKSSIKNKDYKNGIKYYQQYVDVNPNDNMAMLTLIQAQLVHGNPKKIEQLMRQYEDSFGQNDSYLIEKARYYVLTKRYQKALTLLKPLSNKYPTNKSVLYLREQVTKTIENNSNKNLLFSANVAMKQRNMKSAVRLYQEYVTKNPQNKEAALQLIRAYLAGHNMSDAQKSMAAYLAKFGNDNAYAIEKVRYLMLTNQLEDAQKVIEPLYKDNKTNKNIAALRTNLVTIKQRKDKALHDAKLLALAKNADNNNRTTEAIEFYQTYLKTNSKDEIVILKIQQLKDKLEAAKPKPLDYAKTFGRSKQYYVNEVQYYLATNRPNEALTVLSKLLSVDVSDRTLLALKKRAMILKQQQNVSDRESMEAVVNQALQNKKNTKEIISYRTYIRKHPNDKKAFLTLIDLEMQQGNYANVMQLISTYSTNLGVDNACLVRKVRVLTLTNKQEEALALINSWQKKDPLNKELQRCKQIVVTQTIHTANVNKNNQDKSIAPKVAEIRNRLTPQPDVNKQGYVQYDASIPKTLSQKIIEVKKVAPKYPSQLTAQPDLNKQAYLQYEGSVPKILPQKIAKQEVIVAKKNTSQLAQKQTEQRNQNRHHYEEDDRIITQSLQSAYGSMNNKTFIASASHFLPVKAKETVSNNIATISQPVERPVSLPTPSKLESPKQKNEQDVASIGSVVEKSIRNTASQEEAMSLMKQYVKISSQGTVQMLVQKSFANTVKETELIEPKAADQNVTPILVNSTEPVVVRHDKLIERITKDKTTQRTRKSSHAKCVRTKANKEQPLRVRNIVYQQPRRCSLYAGADLNYVNYHLAHQLNTEEQHANHSGARLYAGYNLHCNFSLELGGNLFSNDNIIFGHDQYRIKREALDFSGKFILPVLVQGADFEVRIGEAYLHVRSTPHDTFSRDLLRPVMAVGFDFRLDCRWSLHLSYSYLFEQADNHHGIGACGAGLIGRF